MKVKNSTCGMPQPRTPTIYRGKGRWGVENLVSDIVRACGQVCTCASNTVMRVTFAICGFKE